MDDRKEFWDLLDAHVTLRLVAFHKTLVERGQIAPPPSGYGVTGDCRADRAVGGDQSLQQCD